MALTLQSPLLPLEGVYTSATHWTAARALASLGSRLVTELRAAGRSQELAALQVGRGGVGGVGGRGTRVRVCVCVCDCGCGVGVNVGV